MATVKVSEDTYRKLNKLAGKLRSKTGRPISFDEALNYVLKEKTTELSPSDFIGAWSSISDKEEEDMFRGLEKFRKGWKPRRN